VAGRRAATYGLAKAYLHCGDEPRLAFWRTARGSEVDIVLEDRLRPYPVEVKASATPRPEMARGIGELTRALAAARAEGMRPSVQPGYVVYVGDRVVPLGGAVTGLPLGLPQGMPERRCPRPPSTRNAP
jgi:hypothetical protein